MIDWEGVHYLSELCKKNEISEKEKENITMIEKFEKAEEQVIDMLKNIQDIPSTPIHQHIPHHIGINLSVQVGLVLKNIRLIPCQECKLVYFEELPDTLYQGQPLTQKLRLVK